LPISTVREIVRIPEITSVPNVPDYIEGVINLRGQIISVVDLRKRLGTGMTDRNKRNRIVIVDVEDRQIGLVVSSASEVFRIPASEIEDPQSVFREGELDYVTGVGKLNGRLVILLDLKKILRNGQLHTFEGKGMPEENLPASSIIRNH